MNKYNLALEIKERMDELDRLVNLLTDEDMIREPITDHELGVTDWSEDTNKKTYLELAKQDLRCVSKDKNNLKNTAHSVTVLIAQCFEKCLCHLLMLKGEKFIPTHSHSKLLRQVKSVYPNFPECFGEVEASLCELWYQTNRYPQRSQRGYESYYLILNMIKVCDKLIYYCEQRDKECSNITFDFKEYEASRLLRDDEIGDLLTKDSLKEINKNKKFKHSYRK